MPIVEQLVSKANAPDLTNSATHEVEREMNKSHDDSACHTQLQSQNINNTSTQDHVLVMQHDQGEDQAVDNDNTVILEQEHPSHKVKSDPKVSGGNSTSFVKSILEPRDSLVRDIANIQSNPGELSNSFQNPRILKQDEKFTSKD